jgi:hypothetical protein
MKIHIFLVSLLVISCAHKKGVDDADQFQDSIFDRIVKKCQKELSYSGKTYEYNVSYLNSKNKTARQVVEDKVNRCAERKMMFDQESDLCVTDLKRRQKFTCGLTLKNKNGYEANFY